MEYVAGALGGTLGFIQADVPGAYTGYKLGKKAYKFFTKKKDMVKRSASGMVTPPRTPKRRKVVNVNNKKTKFTRKNKVVKKRTAWKVTKKATNVSAPYKVVGVSNATNAGNFKTPSKLTKFFEQTALKNGYHLTRESIGQVTDADCVYVYHSDYQPERIARVLVGALLRSLFRKAGIEIGNQETEIPTNGALGSAGFSIQYSYRNPTNGVIAVGGYDTVDNISFLNLVNEQMSTGRMGDHFLSYMRNDNDVFAEPYALALYVKTELGLGSVDRIHTYMTLQNEMVVYQAKSSIMVQNRTQGASAGAGDLSADRIDNQPLQGYLYQFKNGDPRLKQSMVANSGITYNEDYLYNTGDYSGCRIFGGSTIPSTTLGMKSMNEPPVPKLWRNVDTASKVHLEPGEMKRSVIVTEYKNRLPELLKKFKIDVLGSSAGITGAFHYSKLPSHKSQIIALEECLRTTSSNLVTCLFENEYKVGAYTYSKNSKGVLKSEISAATIPQFTP